MKTYDKTLGKALKRCIYDTNRVQQIPQFTNNKTNPNTCRLFTEDEFNFNSDTLRVMHNMNIRLIAITITTGPNV